MTGRSALTQKTRHSGQSDSISSDKLAHAVKDTRTASITHDFDLVKKLPMLCQLADFGDNHEYIAGNFGDSDTSCLGIAVDVWARLVSRPMRDSKRKTVPKETK